jgi:two-component system cell cycle response regulator
MTARSIAFARLTSRARSPVGRGLQIFAVLGGTGLLVHALQAAGGPGGAFVVDWVYCAMFALTAAACAWRAARDRTVLPWGIAAAGVVLWGSAEAAYRLLEPDPRAWFPPVSLALLGLGFALAYTTIGLLARARVPRPDAVLALDGLIVGLAASSLAAALIFPVLAGHHPAGEPPETFLALALLPLVFVLTVHGLTRWRPGAAWALVTTAIAVNVAGDVVLVRVVAAGDLHRGSPADTLFAASALLLGAVSFLHVRSVVPGPASPRRLAIPAVGGALAVGLLVVDVGAPLARTLAAAALAAVLTRMLVAVVALERSRREVLTDGLTGLGNRRRLLRDLGERLATDEPFTLGLFDLDGFKTYNDTFGHLSGDALLVLLAERLAAAVAPGTAYRMGGDEFCVLVAGAGADARPALEAAGAALCERGHRFAVQASAGAVALPAEAREVRDALIAADTRMYADKQRRRDLTGVEALAAAIPFDVLREEPLDAGIVAVAVRVASRLGLGDREAECVGHAAALHDVGKVAIPDEVLDKRGPLDADEWRLMRQHPVVGERILRANPALADAARLVRSSHERWDGRGYPDGLAGEGIELGARIVAVCDAYTAMRTARPHRPARSRSAALDELHREVGRQFDPAVVEAFEVEIQRA